MINLDKFSLKILIITIIKVFQPPILFYKSINIKNLNF